MDKQKFYSSILSSVIIGIFILISAIIIGNSIHTPRYEFISRGAEVIIFDTKTGEYYTKFDMDNEAPTDWTKVENPFETE